jgi:hypothetical protein
MIAIENTPQAWGISKAAFDESEGQEAARKFVLVQRSRAEA